MTTGRCQIPKTLECERALRLAKGSIFLEVAKWTRTAKYCKGLGEETTTGVLKSEATVTEGEMAFHRHQCE